MAQLSSTAPSLRPVSRSVARKLTSTSGASTELRLASFSVPTDSDWTTEMQSRVARRWDRRERGPARWAWHGPLGPCEIVASMNSGSDGASSEGTAVGIVLAPLVEVTEPHP